jgi:hypothetical protein
LRQSALELAVLEPPPDNREVQTMLFVWIGLLLVFLLALLVRGCWAFCKRCGNRDRSVEMRTAELPATAANKKPLIRAVVPTKKNMMEEATTSTTV